jgi:hypothetical protein
MMPVLALSANQVIFFDNNLLSFGGSNIAGNRPVSHLLTIIP